jgi:hypothetical protein
MGRAHAGGPASVLSRRGHAKEGALADKSTQLLLDALSRAVADPGGVPLYGNRKTPGLFAKTARLRPLAERCKDEGYLRVVQSETHGKNVQEVCAITEKGIAYLLSQVSPKQILEQLVHTLQSRQAQVGELVAAARQWQVGIESLQTAVTRILDQIHKPNGVPGPYNGVPGPAPSGNGCDSWPGEVINYLSQWRDSGATEDCPLPELYRRAQRVSRLSIGQFHDGLRRLHDEQRIYLHPWTGPMHEIPEPAYALLIGHEVLYYASSR